MRWALEHGMIVRRVGKGPRVVWIHGLGESSVSFEPVIARMPDYTHVLVDLPGYGRSPWPGGALPLGVVADVLAKWLDDEHPSTVIETLKRVPLLTMPRRHAVLLSDVNPAYLEKILLKTYERAPENFETLLGMQGVGGRTLRALALVSEIIYGTPASTRDPARFSFAHGGKDGFPYPVDTPTYDKTVEVLRAAVNRAGIERSERVQALKRLVRFGEERVRARLKTQE